MYSIVYKLNTGRGGLFGSKTYAVDPPTLYGYARLFGHTRGRRPRGGAAGRAPKHAHSWGWGQTIRDQIA